MESQHYYCESCIDKNLLYCLDLWVHNNDKFVITIKDIWFYNSER